MKFSVLKFLKITSLIALVSFIGCNSKTSFKSDRLNNDNSWTNVLDNYVDWGIYRGDQKGSQYSALDQINTANVHLLEKVWEYEYEGEPESPGIYSNPIIVDGVLYFNTPHMKTVALNAVNGEEIWVFDPADYKDGRVIHSRSRGVIYWEDENGNNQRIFSSVRDRVYAIDAKTGKLIEPFGQGEGNRFIDLRQNLPVPPELADIEITTQGAVYQDILIIPGRQPEGNNSTPGDIRGYYALTGEFEWIFNTIPLEGQYGYDTWEFEENMHYGGANPWGGITIDEERGWVFAATGAAAGEFIYGGSRKGKNLFSSTVLALDAKTGKRQWHYQVIRHDIFDYDLTNITPESRKYALEQFRKYNTGSLYTPASMAGTITTPGHLGGLQWHGGAFNPETNMLFINANEAPTIHILRPLAPENIAVEDTPVQGGKNIYNSNCTACHGMNKAGNPPFFPPLTGLQKSRDEIHSIIVDGKGGMPPFSQFSRNELNDLIAYLENDNENTSESGDIPVMEKVEDIGTTDGNPPRWSGGSGVWEWSTTTPQYANNAPFFVDHMGYPAISPPWGTLNAVDLSTGQIKWKIPLGEYPDLVEKGIRNTGTVNMGGAVATAGGLIFIGATQDEKFRAFDQNTGQQLWEYQLPAGGYATPGIYMIDGKQYVVIAAGGGAKPNTKLGKSVVSFCLPD